MSFSPAMHPLKRPLAAGYLLLFLQILASEGFCQGNTPVPILQTKVVARGDPSKPAEMYWVLTSLPTEKDICHDVPGSLRDALKKALKALAQKGVVEWNLKRRASCNFQTELQLQIPDRYQFALEFLKPPNASTSHDPHVVVFRAFCVPVASRKALAVHIIVTGSRLISENPVRTTLGILAQHGVAGLTDLSEDQKAVPVWVSDAAFQGSGIEWQQSPEHLHAYDVAAAAFQSANKHGLRETSPNEGNTSERVVTEIRNALQSGFQLSPTWQTVSAEEAKTLVLCEGEQWVITIPLHAVSDVKFEFSAVQTEGKEISWDSYLYADQLTAVKAEEEARIDQKSEPYFAELRGKLLTLDELKSQVKPILTSLQRIRSVLHSGGPGSRDHDLVFNGVWLPNETEFTAGVGYSSDKGVGGKIGLTSRNLPLVKNSLLDLGIEAGTEKQDGHLSYTLPDYYKSADGRLSFQLDLTAGYKRDRDQKLGAPDSAGVREGRATGALKNVLRFTANPAATGGASPGQPATFGYGATLETTLGYSNTQLRTSEKDPALQDGSVFFALADLQQRGWRDLRKPEAPGIGRVEMSWQLRGKKGFTAGLGDFDFFTAETKIALTIYFGHESSRDFFVRVLVGGAISRGNTPIFEEFRLGGDTIVRGLEEGERLAREVAYDSMEAGVRAGRVWQWVSRTRDNKPAVSEPASSTSSPTPSVGGFDLGNSYISLFFDHAYIARPSSGSGADGLSRNLESVGAALEIPLPTSAVQGRLRIGYAWSPQSIHEQGRSFASVTLDFP